MLPLPHFSNTSANLSGNINVCPYVHPLRNRRGRRRRQRFVYDPYMTYLAWAKNVLLGILRLAETPYKARGNHPEPSIGYSSIAHQEQDSAFGECICVVLSPDLRIWARAGRAAISIPTHVFYENHGIPENRVGYIHSKWKDFRDFQKFHFLEIRARASGSASESEPRPQNLGSGRAGRHIHTYPSVL